MILEIVMVSDVMFAMPPEDSGECEKLRSIHKEKRSPKEQSQTIKKKIKKREFQNLMQTGLLTTALVKHQFKGLSDMLVVVYVSCVYPLGAIVIMSFASRHAMRTGVKNQTKQLVVKDL